MVVDTYVWLSAALSTEGAPARVARLVLVRAVPVFSASTFAELAARLWAAKFDRYITLENRRRILSDMKAAALWVDIPPGTAAVSHCRDPSEDMFVHTALAAGAKWLVTGDQDLLSIPSMKELRILKPADVLNARDIPWAGEAPADTTAPDMEDSPR